MTVALKRTPKAPIPFGPPAPTPPPEELAPTLTPAAAAVAQATPPT
jgi:hypothetical protein